MEKKVGIIGSAIHRGQPKYGTQLAPDAIRKAGLIEQLKDHLGHEVIDYGNIYDIDVPEEKPWYQAKDPMTVAATGKAVCDAVGKALEENHLVLNLGGDHTMALGSFQGHLKHNPDACLLWVDAHADINLPFNTPSGNMHGMPVGLHLRELAETVTLTDYFQWFDRRVAAANIAYLALRDLDDDERRIIRHLGIKTFTMHSVERFGIAHCIKECLDAINPKMDKPIHLSFDIDAMDPALCPSTGTAVPGGLSMREGRFICEELQKTGMLRVVDLAEVNPIIGSRSDVSQTIDVAVLLLMACAGDIRDISITSQHWLSKISPLSSRIASLDA